MFTMEIVLSAILISSPIEVNDPALWEILYPTTITIALDAQLIDKRELHFLDPKAPNTNLNPPGGFFDFLQKRYKAFQNAPRVEEASMFFGEGTRKLINDRLKINRDFITYLNLRLTVDCFHEDIIKDAIAETNQLYQVYDLLRDANVDYYYVTVRREALCSLRNLIGAEAYYSGNMPPSIPMRHIPRR